MEGRRGLKSIVSAALCCVLCFSSLASASFKYQKWDHFTYAQQWPQSVCIDNNLDGDHKCTIKKNVTTWTTHGLWPSLGKSETTPGFCNNSYEFDYNKIKSLQDDLVKYWPNLFADTEFSSFWKHEWTKHGTCCLDLKETSGELNYFKKGLKLNRQFDIYKLLKSQQIVPSDKREYPFTNFTGALTKALGAKPLVSCTYDKKTKTQYVAQIEICTDKKFNVIPCPAKKIYQKNGNNTSVGRIESCYDIHPVTYPIIKHNNS